MRKRWFAASLVTLFLVVALPAVPAVGQAGAAAVQAVTSSSAPKINTGPVAAPGDGIYFADVLVRGQPVFQVGSLNNLSVSQRAAIISRRIASLLERTSGNVRVNTSPASGQQNLLTIQANNRVLMTVTGQDAEDFGVPLEALAKEWADKLSKSFKKQPVVVNVAQRLNATVRQFSKNAIGSIPALIGVLIVIIVTWLVAKGFRYSAFRWAERTEGDHATEVLVGRLCYGGVWIGGAVIALGVWGIDFATMLGALGLTSVAIGFSLKDVLSNYISGVILLASRPFGIGDQVVIKGFEGTITQVQLRSTTIKTYDGRMIYIPNQEVFQASITNNTAASYLRSSVMVGIDYDADIVEARRVIVAAIATLPDVQPSPPPEVLVHELAASTVNLEVRFWVDSHRAGFLATTSVVAQRVKEALQSNQIEMPTEIYTLLLKDIPDDLKQKNGSANGDQPMASQSGTEGTLTEA